MYNADKVAWWYYDNYGIDLIRVFPLVGTNIIGFVGLWETWHLAGSFSQKTDQSDVQR